MITVSTYASRILKSMCGYVNLVEECAPSWLPTFALEKDEEAIGIYQNNPGDREEAILVTTQGLRWFTRSSMQHVSYCEIESVQITQNPAEKSTVDGLTILLADNTEAFVPVGGRRGKHADVFEFARFLDRVVRDSSSWRK